MKTINVTLSDAEHREFKTACSAMGVTMKVALRESALRFALAPTSQWAQLNTAPNPHPPTDIKTYKEEIVKAIMGDHKRSDAASHTIPVPKPKR